MKAKITCIYDEGALEGTNLIGARGSGFMIEVDGQRTLFGVGRRGRYLTHNMVALDIEYDSIDRVVISHGHTDHFGALPDLLKERMEPLDVYAPSDAWAEEKRVFGSEGIFIPLELMDKANTHDIDDWTELSEHLFVSKPLASESFMLLKTRSGPMVISGCSHFGVDAAFDAVKERAGVTPKGYVGGLHIGKGKKGNASADHIASVFSENNCTILYANHCTGLAGISRLRVNLGLKAVNDFYVGSEIEFDI